jgi:hypothetical protein
MAHIPVTAPAGPAINWKAAIGSGLVAGLVFLVLEMMMVALVLGESPWGPPRMIAAIVLGKGVLPPPATFDFGIVIVAMIVHFILAIVYALIFAFAAQRLTTGVAVAAGGAFGLILYLVNFYGFTAVFPWFAMARNWVSVFAHTVFGLVLGWTYKRLAR